MKQNHGHPKLSLNLKSAEANIPNLWKRNLVDVRAEWLSIPFSKQMPIIESKRLICDDETDPVQ